MPTARCLDLSFRGAPSTPTRAQLLLNLHQSALHPHSDGRVGAHDCTVEHFGEGALDALIDIAEPTLLSRDLVQCILVDDSSEGARTV
jgi:hypothetical protein